MLIQSLQRIAKGEVVIEVTDSGFDPAGEKRVSFSTREKQVVELLAQGLKNKEIAAAMNLAEGTVKSIFRACSRRPRCATVSS